LKDALEAIIIKELKKFPLFNRKRNVPEKYVDDLIIQGLRKENNEI
jgi:hypothetical protein